MCLGKTQRRRENSHKYICTKFQYASYVKQILVDMKNQISINTVIMGHLNTSPQIDQSTKIYQN